MPTKIIQPLASSNLTPIQQQAQNLITMFNAQWTVLQASFAQAAEFVYGQSNPQDAINAFGTSFADLCNLSNAYRGMVAAYTGTTPPSPVPTGATLTLNADGSGTYTAPPTQS